MKHKTLKKLIQDSKFKIQEKGFTLVEVLVTSLVFSIIAMTVSAIFIQIVNLERRAFAVQKIQDNALLVLEEMSRDIRVSKISGPDSPNCTATSISLIHPLKGTVDYRISFGGDGVVQRSVDGGTYVDVSSFNDVKFTKMNFCVLGSSANDNQSPRVTILTTVENKTGKEIMQINLQTTTTSRSVLDEFSFP